MQIVIPNNAELYLLGGLRTLFGTGLQLRAFRNDFNPGPDTIVTDFEECDFPGYAAKNLSALWSVPYTTPDGEAEIIAPAQVWTRTAPGASQTVWGVYATAVSGAQVVYAQRRETPVILAEAGQTFAYSPKFRFRTIVL